MLSPWRCPLPLSEYTTSQVVVYFYSGRWVPITFFSLAEAIALHHRAMLEGREVFVFPPEMNPCNFPHVLDSTVGHHNGQTQIIPQRGRTKPETAVGERSVAGTEVATNYIPLAYTMLVAND